MERLHILLVDDHPIVRKGMGQLLAESGRYAVHEAGDGEEAWRRLQRERFDLLLLDLQMPHLNGLGLVQRLRKASLSQPPIIILSAFADVHQALALFRHGVQGYILKDEALETICDAVQTVLSGDLWVSPRLAARLYRQHPEPDAALSQREREVLPLLARGWSNRRIARELHITENTVRNHIASIFNKLGASSRVAAVILALQRGEIALDEIVIGPQ